MAQVKINANKTSRSSPRCPGGGQHRTEHNGKIVDCPVCGRPVRVRWNKIAGHGTLSTANTRAADQRLRMYREYGIDGLLRPFPGDP